MALAVGGTLLTNRTKTISKCTTWRHFVQYQRGHGARSPDIAACKKCAYQSAHPRTCCTHFFNLKHSVGFYLIDKRNKDGIVHFAMKGSHVGISQL